MKPLSPIRFIKMKTFKTSRADQNVVKLPILLILVSTAKTFWKKNLTLWTISIHVYNAFIDPTISWGNKSIGTWGFMHQDMY